MKTILISALISINTAFAFNCDYQVLEGYTKLYPENDYHSILSTHIITDAKNFSFISYGNEISINYNQPVSIYHASSEYQGGYGVEALVVDQATCSILEVHNVYME